MSGEWKYTRLENPDFKCHQCGSGNIRYRIVESSDGGHEDLNYHCDNCRRDWWVDGSDY